MRTLRAWFLRLGDVFLGSRRDRELSAELESHLQLHIDDNIRAGMTPQEARRRALLDLGGVAQTEEQYRDRRGLPTLDALRQDATYAVRMLRRDRGFAATVILTLALGIGAATAIFSVYNAVLLRPLPFADPGRLVMAHAVAAGGDRHDVVSYPTWVDWNAQNHSFAASAAYANREVTIDINGHSEMVRGKEVTPGFFTVLGVAPALGRPFTEQDATGARTVILSDGFWRRQFGASPDAIGKTVRLMDSTYTVVGVMPAGFSLDPPEDEQLYAALPIDTNRKHGFLRVVGRLRPGVTPARAQAELDAICAGLTRMYGRSNEATASTVEPLADALAGPSRLALLILLGVVGVLMLISCSNVAGLLLARGASRQREMAERAALGAGRGRLVRQLLTESLLLAGAGGAAGLLVADSLAKLLVTLISSTFTIARLDATRTDGVVLLFAVGMSMATGVLFGIVPAWSSARADVNAGLRDAGRSTSSARAPRLRRGLVVAETALALVLLAGAGVLMKTLLTMRATHPGFDARNVLAAQLWLPPTRFARMQDRAPFVTAALERVRALPGVRGAAFVADLPLNGNTDSNTFHIVGRPDPSPDRAFRSGFNIVTAAYFDLMRIPIREGREFLPSDAGSAPGVIVVNEVAAKLFWPDRSAIGQQINLPIARGVPPALLTVVGVCANVRHEGLAIPPRPEIFLNSLQTMLPWNGAAMVVRTAGDPTSVAESVKAALRDVNPNVPLVRLSSLEDVIGRSVSAPRMYSIVFGAFALLAVGLAAIGLYGLVSYSVSQRKQEMGIRMALGATHGELVRLVLTQGVRLAAIGAALGLAGGLAATRVLVGLSAGIRPTDPLTFIVVTLVLLGCAVTASYVPARRAAHVDPMTALRTE